MAKNKLQFQKRFSLTEFVSHYGTDGKCRFQLRKMVPRLASRYSMTSMSEILRSQPDIEQFFFLFSQTVLNSGSPSLSVRK